VRRAAKNEMRPSLVRPDMTGKEREEEGHQGERRRGMDLTLRATRNTEAF
jgi:hypothetical protein